MTNTFLPEGEQIPASSGNYMHFKSGFNKIRILSSAITGYELWVGGKPLRRKAASQFTPDELSKADINTYTKKPQTLQYFWAFPVYNYDTSKVEILEVTQKRIISALWGSIDQTGERVGGILNDEDYGPEPWKYDLVITRDDASDPIQYSVLPKPPKPLEDSLQELTDEALKTINLQALYEGGDPFKASEDVELDAIEKGMEELPFD